MSIHNYKFIVVGAGFAGAVLAERIANEKNEKVLMIEQKSHIGGHCYDYRNKQGILIHKFGPHIFHTNNRDVWEYISRFTDWYYYQHRVIGFVDGLMVPIPFNLNSLYTIFPPSYASILEQKLISRYGFGNRLHILELQESKDHDLEHLYRHIYEKIFFHYTTKQWGGLQPEELDKSVTARVPVVISRDNRYFYDRYQGIPADGYSKVFQSMLKNKKIRVLLNTHEKKLIHIENDTIYVDDKEYSGTLFYTGKVDELFSYRHGELPYRSLRFKYRDIPLEHYQENAIINYPTNYDFTRIAEYKYFEQFCQKQNITTIGIEYPEEYEKEKNDPYYIVPKTDNITKYELYLSQAKRIKNLILLGRLAEYKYYNMDEVIKRSLDCFSSLHENPRSLKQR